MHRYRRCHLADASLLHSAQTHLGLERAATAELLADLAEIDSRKLYLPAGYPSMYAWCVGELRLSEDAAYKRIQAGRAARRFPSIFEALAEGRLHLSGVCLLAPHLTEHTAAGLLGAAEHKTKAEIEQLLAERFPRPDVPAWIQALPAPPVPRSSGQLAPGQVAGSPSLVPEQVGEWLQALRPLAGTPEPAEHQLAPGQVPVPVNRSPVLAPSIGAQTAARGEDRARVTPLSAGRYGVQFTMGQGALDKLHYAQELLGHQVPPGDIAQVVERALDALIHQLEKAKFAATERPRPGQRRSNARALHSGGSSRSIPAEVRRAVWERDQGRCTFVSESGRRCEARRPLEFDHVLEVARGGQDTMAGLRLRCRAHNQYQAEQTFGAEFMRHKRHAAQEARAAAKACAATGVANRRAAGRGWRSP